MKCQSLFSVKNKNNVSKCLLLNFFPTILSIKPHYTADGNPHQHFTLVLSCQLALVAQSDVHSEL